MTSSRHTHTQTHSFIQLYIHSTRGARRCFCFFGDLPPRRRRVERSRSFLSATPKWTNQKLPRSCAPACRNARPRAWPKPSTCTRDRACVHIHAISVCACVEITVEFRSSGEPTTNKTHNHEQQKTPRPGVCASNDLIGSAQTSAFLFSGVGLKLVLPGWHVHG